MKLTAGIEIIPKRDKVTYATNIFGKWEDYSIETYQGKVLKEAVERFKVMLKEGKDLSSEVPSLKQLLNQQPEMAQSQEVKRIDFWDAPPTEEFVVVPSSEVNAIELLQAIEEHKKEEPLPQVTEVVESLKEVIPEEVVEYVDDGEGPKCVIHAYINKNTGRQMYLAGWDNNLDWMISAVPYACSRSKCEKLIKKAEKQIALINAEQRLRTRFPKDLSFEIVEYHDSSSEELTYNDIVRIANEMIESNRAAKRK